MSDTVYVLDQVGIRLVKEKTLISDTQLKRPEQVVGFVSDILREYDREVMCVICLNAKLNPVNMCICSMGAVDKAIASPREIMKTAILSNANGFIILHNHPGGSSQPSLEDMRVTADNLAIKRKRKSYHKIHRKAKRAAAGTSIEHRPVDIDTREEFGHWEMDSVMGQQGKSKNALVVLTERKTRYEKIFKVKDHTAASVVKCINSLERKWGRLFSDIFKTITVDNGTEFADCEGIEKKDKKGKKRTEVYYCHPYCSSERGSNENQNRMIRRHIPKGTNFDRKTKKDIQKVEDWLNNYPRPMFGGRSSQELYEEEMRLII